MIGFRGLAMLTTSLSLMTGTAAPTHAQDPANDCGVTCVDCGLFNWFSEGVGFSYEGEYHMSCWSFGDDCNLCNDTTTTNGIAEVPPAASKIVRAITGAQSGQLDRVVEQYGNRMLIHPSRGLLAIRGLGCKAKNVTVVVFLTADEIKALQSLGVAHLDDFLDDQAPVDW